MKMVVVSSWQPRTQQQQRQQRRRLLLVLFVILWICSLPSFGEAFCIVRHRSSPSTSSSPRLQPQPQPRQHFHVVSSRKGRFGGSYPNIVSSSTEHTKEQQGSSQSTKMDSIRRRSTIIRWIFTSVPVLMMGTTSQPARAAVTMKWPSISAVKAATSGSNNWKWGWIAVVKAMTLFTILGPLSLTLWQRVAFTGNAAATAATRVDKKNHNNSKKRSTKTTGNRSLARPLLLAAVRCIVQLNVVAASLFTFLFRCDMSWTTITWIVMSALYASAEAYQRVEHRYHGLRRDLTITLLTTLSIVIAITAGWNILVGPTSTATTTAVSSSSRFSARTWIPVAGMLMGNAVTTVSLAAQTWTRALATAAPRAVVEASLSRGATWREATVSTRGDVWRTALTPTLQALRVAGIVHIPGMMTGQLLAGQDAAQAAAYQVVLLLLLATTSCTAVQLLVPAMARATLVTRQDRLRSREIFDALSSSSSSSSSSEKNTKGDRQKSRSMSVMRTLRQRWRQTWRPGYRFHRSDITKQSKQQFGEVIDGDDRDEGFANRAGVTLDSTRTFIHWKDYRKSSPTSDSNKSTSTSRTSITVQSTPYAVLDVQDLEVPRAGLNLSLQLVAGDRVGIRGPSGIGKSQLLRTLAGLERMRATSCRLYGIDDWDMPSWRQRVALVAQESSSSAILLPGSPVDYFEQITSFQSQRTAFAVVEEEARTTALASTSPSLKNKNNTDTTDNQNSIGDKATERSVMMDTDNEMGSLTPSLCFDKRFTDMVTLVNDWGIPTAMLHRPWSTLSGGQSQRILLAMAVCLKPDVLLLDESTSAMDEITTHRVEKSLKALGIPLVLVSHDDQQLNRFCNQIVDLVPVGPFTTLPQQRQQDDYGVFE